MKDKDGYIINDAINRDRLHVIGENGENFGEMSRREALNLAQEYGLDLVMVDEKDTFAVTKLMDFGKFLYGKKKKSAQTKKTHKTIQIKEIKLKPKIGLGDYTTKMNQAARFLEEGKHVKFTLQFKGRQPVSIQEVGTKFFDRIKNDLTSKDLGSLMEEKETRAGAIWSRVYYIKK